MNFPSSVSQSERSWCRRGINRYPLDGTCVPNHLMPACLSVCSSMAVNTRTPASLSNFAPPSRLMSWTSNRNWKCLATSSRFRFAWGYIRNHAPDERRTHTHALAVVLKSLCTPSIAYFSIKKKNTVKQTRQKYYTHLFIKKSDLGLHMYRVCVCVRVEERNFPFSRSAAARSVISQHA